MVGKMKTNPIHSIIITTLAFIPIVSCKNPGWTIPHQPSSSSSSSSSNILVAGSANLDTFLPLKRLPTPGENLSLLPNTNPTIDIPGGKGCNQAIACSKLLSPQQSNHHETKVHFLCRLGDAKVDEPTLKILHELEANHVNLDYCEQCEGMSCGRGYVFLEKDTGKVSAVVSGGSNLYGWKDWELDGDDGDDGNGDKSENNETKSSIDTYLKNLFESTRPRCLLLQREIVENVNYRLAEYVKQQKDCDSDRTIVLQDIGGEDRSMTKEMMELCDYIMPNESELLRLVQTFVSEEEFDALNDVWGDRDDY